MTWTLRRRSVGIYETKAGWRLERNGGAVILYGTAAEALKAVKDLDANDNGPDMATVTTITWTVVTRVGRDVVNALADRNAYDALRLENERLREALRSIAIGTAFEQPETLRQARGTIATALSIARKTLGEVYDRTEGVAQ